MFITSFIFAISLVAAPGPAEYIPASDEALTVDLQLDGYTNGYMDLDRMMTFRGCTLERDAAYTYALLMEAAEADGVYLEPIDCYRSYEQQGNAYDRRCPYTDIPVMDTDPITGEQYQVGTKSVRVCSGPPTARAGASNHGWGRAVDFGDGSRTLACRDRALLWLQSNALRFGWVHPPWARCGQKTAEPWHWEYAGLVDVSLLPLVGLNTDLVGFIE